jgi:hypothetical protein
MQALIDSLTESAAPAFAKTILQQLGGNKFMAMTGARNLLYDKKKSSLSMKFGRVPKGKSNHVKITLDPADNGYEMVFAYVRGLKYTVKKTLNNVPPANLQRSIKAHTGLDTRL